MRPLPFILLLLLRWCSAAPLPAQAPVGFISSLTANPAIVAPGSPGSTVTATVSTNLGPVSGLNGLTVVFSSKSGTFAVPVNNGTASIVLDPVLEGSPETVFATFPGAGQPGSSPAQTTILVRETTLNAALSGQFGFLVKTYTGNGGSRGGENVSAGTRTFDGQGNLTGELDFNGALGNLQAAPVTGTYSLDGNAFGRIALQLPGGTQHFDLFAGIGQVNYNNQITQATLTETDSPMLAGSGVLIERTPATGPSDLLFQLDGQADCASCPLTAFPLPVSLTGRVDFSGTTGTVDQTVGAFVQGGIPVMGRLGIQDAFGRFPLQLSEPNQVSQQPSHFAGYVVNASRIFLVSTDPVASTVLLSGTATAP